MVECWSPTKPQYVNILHLLALGFDRRAPHRPGARSRPGPSLRLVPGAAGERTDHLSGPGHHPTLLGRQRAGPERTEGGRGPGCLRVVRWLSDARCRRGGSPHRGRLDGVVAVKTQ